MYYNITICMKVPETSDNENISDILNPNKVHTILYLSNTYEH